MRLIARAMTSIFMPCRCTLLNRQRVLYYPHQPMSSTLIGLGPSVPLSQNRPPSLLSHTNGATNHDRPAVTQKETPGSCHALYIAAKMTKGMPLLWIEHSTSRNRMCMRDSSELQSGALPGELKRLDEEHRQ